MVRMLGMTVPSSPSGSWVGASFLAAAGGGLLFLLCGHHVPASSEGENPSLSPAGWCRSLFWCLLCVCIVPRCPFPVDLGGSGLMHGVLFWCVRCVVHLLVLLWVPRFRRRLGKRVAPLSVGCWRGACGSASGRVRSLESHMSRYPVAGSVSARRCIGGSVRGISSAAAFCSLNLAQVSELS